MDVRTPVLDEKYTGWSVGKRRPTDIDKDSLKDKSGAGAVNKYQEYQRYPSNKNSKLSHPSEARSPSPNQSCDEVHKQRYLLQNKAYKTFTKTLHKVLSSNLHSGNMKDEDSSERRWLTDLVLHHLRKLCYSHCMYWGCGVCFHEHR